MNTAALIEQANTAGIMLALNGDRLAWSASKEPSPELLTQLRESKGLIIEYLYQQQRAWLDRVAALLNTSASTLLERGLIDLDDLAEQYRMHPRFAARLIETSPAWLGVSLVRDEVRASHAREVRTQCVPPEVNNVNTPTRENSANKRTVPEWIAARDAFHSHAVGHCDECYPPAGRYCPTGLNLLALYQRATP
ncbi:MAG: hypothetical protein V7756_13150 [Halopseudomonas sp.]|uniref:TubC N-terminal docking domain-related protein n=1 Tax=Halopseudomonas sp. TaxID=2901191 RepID=UPI0030037107